MINKRILLALLFFLSTALSAFAADYNSIFKEGNSFYEKGDFKSAVISYEKIAKDGIADSSLYYNLGNAYFKLGSTGKSILYYERALKFSPRDREIIENLAYARSLTADKQFEEKRGIFYSFLSGFEGSLSLNELAVIFFVLYFVLFIIGLLYIFIDREKVRFYVKITAVFSGFFFLLFSFFLISRIYDSDYNIKGIVMVSQVKARSGPGENYTEVFTIHEGSKVFLRQRQGDWSQITLPTGYTGWVMGNSVESI